MGLDNFKSLVYHNYYLGLKDLLNKKQFDESPEMKIILDELRENGVVAIENFFTEEQCNNYRTEIDQKMDEYKDTVWRDSSDSDNRIYGAEQVSPLFMDYHQNEFLQQLCERYLQTETNNLITLATRTKFKEGNLGSGGGWHRDTAYHHQFKSVVYLTDVEEETGPFTYILGTHKTNNQFDGKVNSDIKKFDFRLTQEFIDSVKNLGYQEVKYTAKKGTMLLIDTKGIHQGSPLKRDVRYTIFNYFFPKTHISQALKDKFDKLRITSS